MELIVSGSAAVVPVPEVVETLEDTLCVGALAKVALGFAGALLEFFFPKCEGLNIMVEALQGQVSMSAFIRYRFIACSRYRLSSSWPLPPAPLRLWPPFLPSFHR